MYLWFWESREHVIFTGSDDKTAAASPDRPWGCCCLWLDTSRSQTIFLQSVTARISDCAHKRFCEPHFSVPSAEMKFQTVSEDGRSARRNSLNFPTSVCLLVNFSLSPFLALAFGSLKLRWLLSAMDYSHHFTLLPRNLHHRQFQL